MIELEFGRRGRLRKRTAQALRAKDLRYCSRCKTVKDIGDFYKLSAAYCKPCFIEYIQDKQEWINANTEGRDE